jgi:hypothetical protein
MIMVAMQYYYLSPVGGPRYGRRRKPFRMAGDLGMRGLLKAAVLGAALLTGMALAAQAQSVSPSPAAGGTPAHLVRPFGPKPGGTKQWKQERYQPPADYATNVKWHPYSEPGRIGPKPN